MAQWLSPVVDYLNAAKSGTEAGQSLARILNDKQQAADKLAQADRQQNQATAFEYASLASKEREAEQTAAEKLQAAQAQQAALQDWRNQKVDQGQQTIDLRTSAADALNNYRGARLGQIDRTGDQKDTALGLSQQRMVDKESYNAAALNLRQQALDLSKSRTLSAGDKVVLQGAAHSLWAAQKALVDPMMNTSLPAYTNAVNQINDAKGVIDGFRTKAGSTSTTTTAPAATVITAPSAADALTPNTGSLSLGGGVTIGSPTGTGAATSAADALTGTTVTNSLPASSTQTNPYQVGRQYGNLKYLGGDPNDENSWEAAQ